MIIICFFIDINLDYSLNYKIKVVGGLHDFDIFGMYVMMILSQKIVVSYETSLLYIFLIEHEDCHIEVRLLFASQQTKLTIAEDNILKNIIFYKFTLDIH